MESIKYIRDAAKVRAACKVGADGSVIAMKPSKLIIPARFVEKQLAVIGINTYIVGIFAHVVEDQYYAVYTGVAMYHVAPTSITTVKYQGDSYLELNFEVGAKILVSQEVLMDRMLTYRIYDDIISKGHVPWYLGYDDVIKLLFTSDRLAGVNMLANHAMLELNAAAISRDPKQIGRYYRHVLKSYDDLVKDPPTYIPLMSVTYGTTNTTSRILGSYFEPGLYSALANPSTKVENIERLLRA